MTRRMTYALPAILGLIFLMAWEAWVRAAAIPTFVLPAPSAIGTAFATHGATLWDAMLVTLRITLWAFAAALASGIGLAVLFTRARLVEMALYPYVVTLQVTPVVAIAPLILIWVGFEHIDRALIIIGWIVAFFPMLTNTVQGLRSVDPQLHAVLTLSGANWRQRLLYLELPAALPAMLTGAKISGGLALIGAVVAEFVAGSGTATGLAWRIIEAGNRLDIALMFAALATLSALGITLFYTLTGLEWALLRRWHDSYRD